MDMHYFLNLEANQTVAQYIAEEEKRAATKIQIESYLQWKVGDLLQ